LEAQKVNHTSKNARRLAVILFLIAALVPAGCGKQEAAKEATNAAPTSQAEANVAFPDLSEPVKLEKGVYFQEATLMRGGIPMKVWVYLPEPAPAAQLPCVLIAPAGTPLYLGMDLGDGDRPEHLPYVKAGFAVVSYELDGHVPNAEAAGDAKIIAGAKAFKNARAGLSNARAALDFALEKVPMIDPERIYAAGHSSAATLALLVASDDSRIKACVAFAPCTNVPRRLAPAMAVLSKQVPGFSNFVKESSPNTHAAKIKCPVFLFHARDDRNVALNETEEFSDQLKKTNSQVTLVIAESGGHYDSMVKQGIPQAIEWLKDH
jgi:dipeptidyl aminopeptidase/acylaminoacyl peptidase